jgi:hypothetical protein
LSIGFIQEVNALSKNFGIRLSAFLISLTTLFSVVGPSPVKANSDTVPELPSESSEGDTDNQVAEEGRFVLAAFDFESGTNEVSESTDENANVKVETNTSTPEIKTGLRADRGNEGPVLQSLGWDKEDAYWEVVINTEGYSDIEFSSMQASSWRGPRFFEVSFSIDGTNWESLVPKYELDRTWGGDFGILSGIKLPPAAENQEQLHIRWSNADALADVSKEGLQADGQSWIDNIEIVANYKGQIERIPNILRVDWTANSTGGNYWWAISKDPYVFQAGDIIEYDVYIADYISGLGAIEVYASHPDIKDYKFREHFKAGEWQDQNALSGVPATDISKEAYGKWYHRELSIPGTVVGSPIRDFTLGIDNKGHEKGDVLTAYYKNICITNGGEVQHVIYSEGDPTVSKRVSPASNTNYDVEVTPVFNVEPVEPIEPPDEEDIPTGDPIEDASDVFSVGMLLDSHEMQAGKGYGLSNYTIEQAPILRDGIVYVPLYTVIEELGARINWDGATQTVSITQGNNLASHKLGTAELIMNGQSVSLEAESIGFNNSTIMVPLSFFKALGATTSYFADNGRIKITLPATTVSYASPQPVEPVETNTFKDEDIAFRFFVSSDSQGTDQGFYNGSDDGTGKGFELVLDRMKQIERQPDFIVAAGDLVAGTPGHVPDENKAQLENWRKHFEKRFDINLFMPIPGNHEQKGEKKELTQSFQEMFPEFNQRTDVVFAEGYYGTVWYYDIGEARIFGLNNTFSGEYHKIIGSQLDFVRYNIDHTKKQTFFIMHEPPFSTWRSGNGMDRAELERDQFWKVVETAPNPLVFVGHEHLYSRKLINNRFNETVEGESFAFEKQIYQVHIGGFGGGTNGVTRDFRGVLTDPATMGVWHFAIVDALKDGRIHVQAMDYEGHILDDFVQAKDDTELVTPNRVSFAKNEITMMRGTKLENPIKEDIKVTYASGDSNVASVDSNGNITAVGPGTTYITATASGGKHFGGAFAATKLTVPEQAATKIEQVNAHVGVDATTGQIISWTSQAALSTTLTVKDNENHTVHEASVSGTANGAYYNYHVEISGLSPDTFYTYELNNGQDQVQGSFRTAKTDTESVVRFAYIADPQVADAKKAEATGALFHFLSDESVKNPLDFIYIAGDHTDKNANDAQWQALFHNGGLYPEATQEFLLQHSLLSAQGNHDDGGLHGRITTPSAIGGEGEFTEGVFASNYGPIKFIMLNNASYNVTDLADNPGIKAQEDFLRTEVADAKAKGQWVIVGFHKPLYTGASHIDDKDVIAYRKFWNPIFTELDVDFVLAGHDHVYSRGFIDAAGKLQSKLDEEKSTNDHPVYFNGNKSPLHMVAGHAGDLKWYSPVEYTVTDGDPLLPDYQFLDVNSAKESPSSADKKEQTYVIVEIGPKEAVFKAINFKYDAEKDEIMTEPYVSDIFTVLKLEEGEVTVPEETSSTPTETTTSSSGPTTEEPSEEAPTQSTVAPSDEETKATTNQEAGVTSQTDPSQTIEESVTSSLTDKDSDENKDIVKTGDQSFSYILIPVFIIAGSVLLVMKRKTEKAKDEQE